MRKMTARETTIPPHQDAMIQLTNQPIDIPAVVDAARSTAAGA